MKKISILLRKYLFENSFEEQRIVKNSFWLSLARFGGSLFRAILIIYAFRILGPSLQGSFSLAMNFILIFSFIPDFGLTAILIREISKLKEKKKEILANAIFAVSVFIIFSFVIINFTKNIFIKDNLAISLIFFLSLFLIFDTLREFFYSLFRVIEKMELQAFSHLVTNFLLLILGIIFITINPNPVNLVYAYIIASFLGLILTLFLLRKDIFYNYFNFFHLKTIFLLLNKSWPIGIANFLFLILTYLDSLIIGWFHPSRDVGLYSSVVKLTEFLYFFPAALAMSIFPIVAKKDNYNELQKTIQFGSKFAILISLPMFVGLFVLSQEIINFIFGKEYLEAGLALSLISFSLPLNFLLLIFIDVLIALDKRKELLIYELLVVFVNFLLNILFVPKFSYFAASAITSFSTFISLLFTYYVLKKYITISLRLSDYLNYFLASIVMGLLVYLLSLHLIFKIITGILIYFLFLFLLKDKLLKEIFRHQ